MSDSMILSQGLELLYTGMGAVFVFLSILVVATTLMSSVANRFFPESEPAPAVKKARPSASAVPAEVVQVIQAAVNAHRQAKGRSKGE